MRSLCVGLFALAMWMPAHAQDGIDRTAPSKQELLQQYGELGRAGHYAEAAALWATEATNNGRRVSPDRIAVTLEDIYRTFPDYRSERLETFEQGDMLVSMSRVTGTHLGVAQTTFNGGLLRGAKPTGKRFEVLHTHWWRFKDGKIIWHQGVRDDLSMMRQLGLLPSELPVNLLETNETAERP